MTQFDIISKNWLNIKNRIQQSNFDINAIKVLPVTKSVGTTEIQSLAKLGFNSFGENRIEALIEKSNQFQSSNFHWHFIGNIQSRKIPEIADHAHLIHSVASNSVITKLNAYGLKILKKIDILLQVNIAKEPQKGGFSEAEIHQSFKTYLNFQNIRIHGLMTMAPQTNDEFTIRNTFSKLRELRDSIKKDAYPEFKELSMGMSDDFMLALQEGATIIRIGSSFFKEQGK